MKTTKWQIQISGEGLKKEWQTTRTFQTRAAAETAAAKISGYQTRVVEKVSK